MCRCGVVFWARAGGASQPCGCPWLLFSPPRGVWLVPALGSLRSSLFASLFSAAVASCHLVFLAWVGRRWAGVRRAPCKIHIYTHTCIHSLFSIAFSLHFGSRASSAEQAAQRALLWQHKAAGSSVLAPRPRGCGIARLRTYLPFRRLSGSHLLRCRAFARSVRAALRPGARAAAAARAVASPARAAPALGARGPPVPVPALCGRPPLPFTRPRPPRSESRGFRPPATFRRGLVVR